MSIQDVTQQFPIPAKYPREVGSPNRITDIAVHHTYINPLPETATVKQELARIGSIHQYHISRGFLGCGYHGIAFPSGRGYITAPLSQWGANVYTENDHVLGVSVDNKLTSGMPSGKQQHAVAEIIKYFWDYTNREVPIRPHLYWGGTSCPGPDWKMWVPQLKDKVKEDDMALQQIQAALDAHQRTLEAFQRTLSAFQGSFNAIQKTLDAHQKALDAHQKALEAKTDGGGISEARVLELIRATKLII